MWGKKLYFSAYNNIPTATATLRCLLFTWQKFQVIANEVVSVYKIKQMTKRQFYVHTRILVLLTTLSLKNIIIV